MTQTADQGKIVPFVATGAARAALADLDVAAVILFGSRATGHAGPLSDTDLGVVFRTEPNRSQELRLTAVLEERLRPLVRVLPDIQVTILNHVPPGLQLAALQEGQPLLILDPTALADFREAVMRRAGDLLPFLRRFRQERLDEFFS